MMNYVLEITLQSPLTSAAGEGRVGLVDRDVAFDDLGLPILPGRRLKGLWREAYRDVADAWQQCGQSPIPVEQIFGESGQGPGDGDACIHVANAELKAASSLKEWLKYLQHRDERTKKQKLHSDDVVHHFATVRTQTAIDRSTGSAKEDTLRLTRTLKSDLVFRARVHFDEPHDDALQNALALGAASLQHMGTARTRGLGRVCCRLLVLDAKGHPRDLTPPLSQASLPSITGSSPSQPAQGPGGQSVSASSSSLGTPTHVLRYCIRLTAPAVIPVSDGDPNSVVTRQDVPGSHILGATAWYYLRQANHTPIDKAFRHAFLDGGLRFLAAYPEADDTQQRMIPIPHSVRKFKNTEELVDLVEHSPEDEPTKRLDRRYARIGQRGLETQSVKTELNYHHARAGDRRKGRALGAEVSDGGAFFRYEAIQAGQSFQGAILGSEGDLTDLKTWLQELNTISVGRSRSAQYGEGEFEWIDPKPQKLSGLVEWDGFATQQEPPNLGKYLIITTLCPLLTANDDGHPDARFPEQELAKALGLNTSELTLSSSYTRTEVIGGYHAHLRLPRQQWPAIAAGSVFVFELKQDLNNECEERLVQLEHNGLGLRKGEGYGRIAVNRQKEPELTNSEEIPLDGPDRADVPYAPDSEILEGVQDLQDLLKGIVRTRSLAEMQEGAMTVTAENLPSNALLGRLRLFLQQDASAESLDNLRKPAKEGLMNCQITRGPRMSWLPNRITLYDLFKKAWTEPDTLTKELIQKHAVELLKDGDADNTRQALINQLVEDTSKEMCKVFLNHLLTTLHRKSRT